MQKAQIQEKEEVLDGQKTAKYIPVKIKGKSLQEYEADIVKWSRHLELACL